MIFIILYNFYNFLITTNEFKSIVISEKYYLCVWFNIFLCIFIIVVTGSLQSFLKENLCRRDSQVNFVIVERKSLSSRQKSVPAFSEWHNFRVFLAQAVFIDAKKHVFVMLAKLRSYF